ncbi:MAG TPA: response regulator [Gammaproteobacteria bacterium]|nr:response regulator [Gammaproteobacteria bacterium]
MSVTENLQRAGYAVEAFPDAEQALEYLNSGPVPDLVITDLNMPGMDGISFIKEARGLSGMRFKPILFLTTESEQAKRDEAKAAGATGWLVKPVSAEDLLGAVKQVAPGA